MNPRKAIGLAVASAAIVVGAACDEATTAGHNWSITPDVALHRQTGKPLLRGTGQCGDATHTWIAKSLIEINVWDINQGRTLTVNCGNGYPTGSWGLEERAS